jgi:hypothetical protein
MKHWKTIAPMLGGLALLAGAGAAPTAAQAGEPGCCKPKPPCCKPKPGHDVHIPGVKVYPPKVVINVPQVNVNVSANASAVATSSASSSALSGSTVFFGGGGGGGGTTPGTPNYVNLNVEGAAAQLQRIPYSASRTQIKTVVIRAVCIDDRQIPHPASQVFPGQDVAEHYEGELFRCIAGTKLSVTMGDWLGKVAFDGGAVINCGKGEAFYHGKGGEVGCRKQKAARDCNERSLLRRYGVGVKVFKMIRTETYTAYREEMIHSAQHHSGAIVLDGGVGGIQF